MAVFLRRARIKGHDYLLVLEGHRVEGRVRQRVVRYLGRADRWNREDVEALLQALRADQNALPTEGPARRFGSPL